MAKAEGEFNLLSLFGHSGENGLFAGKHEFFDPLSICGGASAPFFE
jgi:hypothetical protein